MRLPIPDLILSPPYCRGVAWPLPTGAGGASGASDRHIRPITGRAASSARTSIFVHLRSALSFRSSSASCALSTVESTLPLSLPLSSWRSPSRLVSSSPVTAPTACFARPAILSVFSPIAGPPEVDVDCGRDTSPSDDEPSQRCRWSNPMPTDAQDHRRDPQDRSRAITLAGRNSDLDPAPRTAREQRRAPTATDSRQRSPPTPTRSERQAE